MKHPKRPAAFNLLMLTLAGMINAVGITLFLSPVKLYDRHLRHLDAAGADHTALSLAVGLSAAVGQTDLFQKTGDKPCPGVVY